MHTALHRPPGAHLLLRTEAQTWLTRSQPWPSFSENPGAYACLPPRPRGCGGPGGGQRKHRD